MAYKDLLVHLDDGKVRAARRCRRQARGAARRPSHGRRSQGGDPAGFIVGCRSFFTSLSTNHTSPWSRRHTSIDRARRANFRALNAFYYHVLSHWLRCLPATQPAAQADVAEDDAGRGALAAQPEAAAPLSRLAVRRHDPRVGARCGSSARRNLCGGGDHSPFLPRRSDFNSS